MSYKFVGAYSLMESTGWRVEFSPGATDETEFLKGRDASVTAYGAGGEVGNVGTAASAVVNGRSLVLEVDWKNGWNTDYTGEVNDAGMVVNGTKRDWNGREEHFHTWNSTVALKCWDGVMAPDELTEANRRPG